MNGKILAIIVALAVLGSGMAIFLAEDSDFGTEGAFTVVDDRGVSVNFDVPFERIASLGDPYTLILGDIGAMDKIVLVHYYTEVVDTEYPEVADIPNPGVAISGDRTALMEKIIGEEVDIVITYNWGMARENIEYIESDLKVPVLAFSPETYGDVVALIGDIGKISGNVAEAEVVSNRMVDVREAVSSYVESIEDDDKPNVYFELSTFGYKAANIGSISHDIIVTAGGKNVGADESVAALSIEYDQDGLIKLKDDLFESKGETVDMVIVEIKSPRGDEYYQLPFGPDIEIKRFPRGLNSYSSKLADGLLWMLYTLHGVELLV